MKYEISELTMFKRLYAFLCGAASEALTELEESKPEAAAHRLRSALNQAEEYYIEVSDTSMPL